MIGRHELKYICSRTDLALIEAQLRQLAEPDRHAGPDGAYTITSLYFDDQRDTCCRDNDAGISHRYKFRARFYGADPSTLHLEKKIRRYGLGKKYSCPLTPEQLACFFRGNTEQLLYDTPPLLQELAILAQTKLMRPKVIVRYERTPFVCHAGNVRITLDRTISASEQLERFLEGDFLCQPIQPAGEELLEVKFDTILPSELRQAAYIDRLQQTSFSKYYLSRLALQAKGV